MRTHLAFLSRPDLRSWAEVQKNECDRDAVAHRCLVLGYNRIEYREGLLRGTPSSSGDLTLPWDTQWAVLELFQEDTILQ